MNIDTKWFKRKIKESQFRSQRQLALHMKGKRGRLDPAAISLALRGKRSIYLEEAEQFSRLLHVPILDVLRHCGLQVGR